MPAEIPSQDLPSASELIAEARRPGLIARHRDLIEDMESNLSEAMVSGEIDHPRLQAMLRELEADSERQRVMRTLQLLVEDAHYRDGLLRDSLIEQLCLLREMGSIEVAMLQMHVLGVYRAVRRELTARQGETPTLADLRELPIDMLARLLSAHRPDFGSISLPGSVVYTQAFAERCLRTIKHIRRPEGADTSWHDATDEVTLKPDQIKSLAELPGDEREPARRLMLEARVRHVFYSSVFLQYLSPDHLDPRDIAAHPTILHWLEAIEHTGHLYPFMQGQPIEQKRFRLAQLVEKLVQMHEVYARVEFASLRPALRDGFARMKTRERLTHMAKQHVTPLPVNADTVLAALLCPFQDFVTWIQKRVADNDLVVPPDHRR